MSNVTAHQICNTIIAQSSAQLILQRNLYIRNKYTFTLPINYILLEPTDYVTIDDAALGLVSTPVRILTIDESGDELLITAEDAPAGVSSHAIYGTQSGGGGGVNNLVLPGNTGTPYIFVPPSILTATGLEVWMGAYGVAPSTWGGCEVWVSYDNVSYGYVGSIDSPARMGTLTATLETGTDPDTTHTLAVNVLSGQSLGGATTAEWNNYASLSLVDGEYVAYQTATLTSTNNYNLTTLHRGLYGSTIASHASGAQFVRVDQAMFKMPFTPDKIGQTIYVKLPAYNQFGSQLQQLSACTPTTFTIGISQVPTLTGIVLTPVYGGFTIKYTAPTQSDFGGVNVYMSTTSGFTPATGNLVYSGPDSLITITADAAGVALVAGTTYYVRIAGYTTTSKANMSYSSEYSVVPIMASKTGVASLYQWSTAAPSNPSGTSTFTWSTYASSAYTGAGGWSVSAPVNPGTPGIQLWIANKVVSDNATATTTAVSWASGFSLLIAGANGTNGTSGYQSASPTVYQWAATIPAAPAGSPTYTWSMGLFGAAPTSWSLTPGTAPSAGYTLWAAKVSITDSATATTTSFNWTSASITAVGSAGANGTSSYVATIYQQSATPPATPVATASTYNFSTGVLTPPTGWVITQPTTTTTPTYACTFTFTGTGTVTGTGSWSTPFIDAVAGGAGTGGTSTAIVQLFQNAASAPALPSGTITYTFSTNILSGGTMGSWTQTRPASSTTPTYMTQAVFTATAPTNTSTNGVWGTAIVVGQNGSGGTNGSAGASYRIAYMASATTAPGTSPNPETDTGSTTVPTSLWGLSGTWGTTVPTLTAGQFLYSSDGIYNPATNQTTWSIPYWTSLKVGSLSAITVNTGNLTVTGTVQGNTAAISGTTMTGAGFVWYSSGQYAIGNSTTNMTFNGTTGTLNGNWVATGNLFDHAATGLASGLTASGTLTSSGINTATTTYTSSGYPLVVMFGVTITEQPLNSFVTMSLLVGGSSVKSEKFLAASGTNSPASDFIVLAYGAGTYTFDLNLQTQLGSLPFTKAEMVIIELKK